jgi:hypothetical protein
MASSQRRRSSGAEQAAHNRCVGGSSPPAATRRGPWRTRRDRARAGAPDEAADRCGSPHPVVKRISGVPKGDSSHGEEEV